MHCFAFLALVFVTTLGTSSALVDASRKTTVAVVANAYDERTSGAGCSPDGCIPENTRDGSRRSNSRWSCKKDLIATEGERCTIIYYFKDPQDIVRIRIAFYKGKENQRRLKVRLNGRHHSIIKSSGTSNGYQNFVLDSDKTSELSLEARGLSGDDWISIKEVKILV